MKAALALIIATLSLPASASPITLDYSGSVSSLTYADCQSYTSSGSCNAWNFTSLPNTDFVDGHFVSIGDTFSGTYVYDPAAPLTAISNDGHQAIHLNSIATASFSAGQLQLPGTYLPQAGLGSFSIVNDRNGYDSFFLQSLFSGTDFFASVDLDLQDHTGRIFDSFDVPQTLNFTDFNANVFHVGMLRRSDGDQVLLYGALTSVSIASPIPEPKTPLLMLLGLVLIGLILRRNSRLSLNGLIFYNHAVNRQSVE